MLGEKTKQTFCIPLQKDQKTPRNPGQSWYPKTRNPSLAAGKVLLHVTAVHDVDRSLGHSLIRFESSVIPFHVKFLYSWHFISHPKCSCQAEWNRISTQNDVLLMTADLDLYQYSTAIYINTSVPLGVLFFFTFHHPPATRLGLTLPFDPPLASVENKTTRTWFFWQTSKRKRASKRMVDPREFF